MISERELFRLAFEKVIIVDVDVDHNVYPLALGRGHNNVRYEINLNYGWGGRFVVPEINSVWWVERRALDWALALKEELGVTANSGLGDVLEQTTGNYYLKAAGVKIADDDDTAFETGFSGPLGSWTFKHGLLVGSPTPGGTDHPDLAAHDDLGLATQTELNTHTSAASPHSGHETPAGAQTKVDTHTGDAVGAHAASAVSFTPSGLIVATDVQAALQELDSEKQAVSQKAAANGYASLDAGTKVPTAQLGGAGADATKFLRGDQSWVAVSGGASNLDALTDVAIATPATTQVLRHDGTEWKNSAIQDGDLPATITRDSELVNVDPAAHTLVGAKHTASGLAVGQVLRASSATAFAFAALVKADLPSAIAYEDEANTFTEAQTINGGTQAKDRLNLGSDTSIYRGNSGEIWTEAELKSVRSPVTLYSRRTKVTGDSDDRYGLQMGGKQEWGPGNGPFDTNFYRNGIGELKTDHSLEVVGALTKGGAAVLTTAHEGAADPHTGYQKESEKGSANGYASLDAGGKVPDAEIPVAIARDSEVTEAVSDHAALADPHTGYQKESEKGAVSGYASLDAGTKVPTAELGGAGADATKFLRGDQSWAVPAGGAASWDYLGGVELGSAAAATSLVTIAARDLLLVAIRVTSYSGGGDIASLRFNGDSGTNYSTRYIRSVAGGVALTNVQTVSATLLRLFHTLTNFGRSALVHISNHATTPKACAVNSMTPATSAATAPTIEFGGGTWHNSAAQITSMDMRTAGGSVTMGAGSGFAVFGKDIP